MKLLYAGPICLVLAVPCAARVITVDDNGPGDFNTIQAAIDDANDGDTIVVNDGTYTGEGNRDIDFKGKSITVRSESGPEDCIVDCQGSEGNFHRGFYFHSGEDQNSVVDGFTIGNGFHGRGAGILCIGSSPIIRNNVITGNEIAYDADGGAGIGCWRGASPTIIDNIISNNTCAPGGGGGGIRCYEAGSPTITNNIISRNTASQGGGMCVDFSSPTISDCAFSGNSATGMGGGILTDSNMVLTNCTFIGNSARTGGGMYNYRCNTTLTNCSFIGNLAKYSGGAIYSTRDSHITLRSCLLTGNRAGTMGGAIYSHGVSNTGELILINCTFAGNLAPNGKALACDCRPDEKPSDLDLTNCILWDGGDEIWNNGGSAITITHSDTTSGWPGTGNINADPCFADPGHWDLNGTPDDANDDFWVDGYYRLQEGSPCIDVGTNNPQAGLPETDIEGNRLPKDGDGDGTAIVDMGAYEYQYPICTIIYVDDDATGANNGTSWKDAFNYLQLGMLSASDGNEIRVAQGVYKPHEGIYWDVTDIRSLTFQLINGVTIKGGYAGVGESNPDVRDVERYQTTLRGDLAGNDVNLDNPEELGREPTRLENAYRVVTGSGTNKTAILDGFTITGGNANYLDFSQCNGAGMYNDQASPIVIDCTFILNFAGNDDGGGLGAAIFNYESHPVLTGCKFIANAAIALDGGEGCGGAMANWSSNPTLTNCQFIGNVCGRDGGGMWNYQSSPVLVNCLLAGNLAREGGSGSYGGAIWSWDGSLSLTNCTFAGNVARSSHIGDSGGAVYCERLMSLTLLNSIFYGNRSTENSQIALRYCDAVSIRYCNIEGGSPHAGDGNVDVVPQFVAAGWWDHNGTPDDLTDNLWTNGDYHLKSQAGRWNANEGRWTTDQVTSPCIDAGGMASPIGHEPFPNGGIVNMGAYGGTAEASKSYFGKPVCETIVAGDINGDCKVDWADLRLMALHWLQENQ